MTYPSRLLLVGIGKETVYGSPVVPAMVWPVEQCAPVDRGAPIPDVGWRVSAGTTFGHQPGPLDGVVQLAGAVFPDTIGFPLAGILGDVAFAGGTPNTWTMAALNSGTQQPPSYTITTSDPVGALMWSGCKFGQLEFALNPDGLFTFTAEAAGLASLPNLVYAATPSAVKVLAGWSATITIGGSVESRCSSLTYTISRAMTPKRNVNGTRQPYLQRTGQITVTGKATVVMTSDAYRAQFVNGTATSLDVTIGQGAGAGQTQVKLHSTSVTLTGAARSYGQSWIEVDLAWVADNNGTDIGASGGLSPVKATLLNAVATGTYA